MEKNIMRGHTIIHVVEVVLKTLVLLCSKRIKNHKYQWSQDGLNCDPLARSEKSLEF